MLRQPGSIESTGYTKGKFCSCCRNTLCPEGTVSAQQCPTGVDTRALWHCRNEKADGLSRHAPAMKYTGPEPTVRNELQHWACREQWQQWREATKYRQAKQLLRQANHSFTKYALLLSRADLRILTGLLTGHADLNRHLTLMQILTDAVCPWCQEDEETVLHLLGECNALSAKRVYILGSLNLGYEALGKVHWHALFEAYKSL